MDHITLNIFTLKKNGTITTKRRTTIVSYPDRRDDAILASINRTRDEKGFI